MYYYKDEDDDECSLGLSTAGFSSSLAHSCTPTPPSVVAAQADPMWIILCNSEGEEEEVRRGDADRHRSWTTLTSSHSGYMFSI